MRTLPALASPAENAVPRRGRSRIGVLAVLALVLAATASLLTVPAAAPASAVGNCVASTREALWYTSFSVQLKRKTNCTYYTRVVIDDGTWGVGAKLSFKVERQEKSPYGWFVTDTKSKTMYWGEGTFNTGTVDGWYPTAWEGSDNHRSCWRFGSGSWTCTPWAGI